MATVPVSRTWVAGEVVTAGYMNNNITAVQNWLLAPAILRVRQTSAQSIASGGGGAKVLFDTEDVDSTGMHSTVSNTSRATAVYPGYYRDSGGVSFAATAGTVRTVDWSVNGTAVPGSGSSIAGFTGTSNRIPARTVQTFLNVGDYLELNAFQNTGAALSLSVIGVEQPSMDLTWVSN